MYNDKIESPTKAIQLKQLAYGRKEVQKPASIKKSLQETPKKSEDACLHLCRKSVLQHANGDTKCPLLVEISWASVTIYSCVRG